MLNQHQSIGQHLTINPKQIAQLAVFQLDTLNLKQRIEYEIEENPFLDKTDNAVEEEAKRSVNEALEEWQSWEDFYNNDYTDRHQYFVDSNGFEEQWYLSDNEIQGDYRTDLKQQLKYIKLTPIYYNLGCFILDSCNDKGYLELDITTLADDFSFKNSCCITEDDVRNVIAHVQQLEPLGVASSGILEYYLLQVSQKGKKNIPGGTLYVLNHHFTDLQRGRWKEINQSIAKNNFSLTAILGFLSRLRKAPVDTEITSLAYIIPDFILSFEGDNLKVGLNKTMASSIKINSSYAEEHVFSSGVSNQNEKIYLRQKYQQAQWFVEAIRLREKHLLQIMHCIVLLQQEYFCSGCEIDLKPMLMKHIVDKTGLNISVVSRLISNKHIATPFGTVSLKSLFSEGVPTTTGEAKSSAIVELAIKNIVKDEDKARPFTDKQITTLLRNQGYMIARRTVTKYRERMGLPVCKVREQTAKGKTSIDNEDIILV
ncbi:MAG: RNA polymerase factor sigma-54 [Chitinophagaceae bacterium]|nr:RNA polymerase factor sigma-54 [Chitinophagaceae bacterium]